MSAQATFTVQYAQGDPVTVRVEGTGPGSRRVLVEVDGDVVRMDQQGQDASGHHVLAALGAKPSWWDLATHLQTALAAVPEVPTADVVSLVRDTYPALDAIRYDRAGWHDWQWLVLALSPSDWEVLMLVDRRVPLHSARPIPARAAAALAEHPSVAVRVHLARSIDGHPSVVRVLAGDPDATVRAALARNSTSTPLPDDVVDLLVADASSLVREDLATYKHLTVAVQQRLCSDDDPDVRYALAGRRGLSAAVAVSLADDREPVIRDQARKAMTNARRRERAARSRLNR